MTLKAPLNPWHMIPNSMEVFIAKKWSDSFLQLWFYKDQSLASAGETVEDVYSNGTLKKTRDGDKLTVNITAHELTVEKLAILQSGLVEVHPWTVTAEVEKWNPWDWSYDKDIILQYSNADWTAISPTSVKALINWTEQALVASTDYSVWVTMFWATYIKLLSGSKLDASSPSSVRITVTYSSVNAVAKVMDHKTNALAAPFVMVLKNEYVYDWETKRITTYLDNCLASKATLQQIADNDDTTVGFPVEITGTVIKQDFEWFSLVSPATETETETENESS